MCRRARGGGCAVIPAVIGLRATAKLYCSPCHVIQTIHSVQHWTCSIRYKVLPPPTAPQAYGRELDEAYEWCLKYKQSRKVCGVVTGLGAVLYTRHLCGGDWSSIGCCAV